MTPEQLAAIKAHLEDVFVWDGHHESTIEHARALVAEVERLQRVEAAAKAYRVAVVNGGINAAEDELFAAIDAAGSGG